MALTQIYKQASGGFRCVWKADVKEEDEDEDGDSPLHLFVRAVQSQSNCVN